MNDKRSTRKWIQRRYDRAKKMRRFGRKCAGIGYKWEKLIINILAPITAARLHTQGIDEESKVIISLTTYPARIQTVYATIGTLLRQSVKPKKVVLWLAEDQFANQKLPQPLLRLKKYGLEIRYCDDLKPHKKYFESMQRYPEYSIVTADDDVFYPEDFLKNLLEAAASHPNTVICSWSHQISFEEDLKSYQKYNDWPDERISEPDYLTLPVGCNGVLYPAKCMPQETFCKDHIREYALMTDDLWLKCMEVLNHTMAYNYDLDPLIYFNNMRNQGSTGLWKSNAAQSEAGNDIVWKKLMKQYPEADRILRESCKKTL